MAQRVHQLTLFEVSTDEIDQFASLFTEAEWNRICGHLDLILRDRNIRREFRHLRANGAKYDQAIRHLSGVWHLSESQISHIVYPRRRAVK